MKFLHLGDLHFGKRINNLPLIDDQKYINSVILQTIDEKRIEAVLIAGDVYDRAVPSEEAVNLFDDFLVQLANRKLPVLVIAGNHDSAERLSFGDRLIEAANVYISPEYNGTVKKVTLPDAYGEVDFYLMPFVKPANVKHCFPDEPIENYTDALRVAIQNMQVDPARRSVILSHQFVTGAATDGSEDELYVGGVSNVDASVYDVFDYAALGHIHRPQDVQHGTVRYSGSPMKFSFNEEKQDKCLTIVDLREKGSVEVELLPLEPKRDFVTIKGSFNELKLGTAGVSEEDFVSVVLTDEEDVPNAFSILSSIYPGIQKLSYDNRRTRSSGAADGGDLNLDLQPIDLVAQFYAMRNGQPMSEEQAAFMEEMIQSIWGGQK